MEEMKENQQNRPESAKKARQPINYQNGRIYEIIDDRTQKTIYVGSTCQTLAQRMSAHRALTQKTHSHSNVVHLTMKGDGVENFSIYLIELFPCKDKSELQAREYHWIKQRKAPCNIHGTLPEDRKMVTCECGKEVSASNYRQHYFSHRTDTIAQPAMTHENFRFPIVQ